MPAGGQINLGSGLRLQQSTPGVTDTGNFNISGVGRSTGGTLGATGPYIDGGSGTTPSTLGLYQTFRFQGTNALNSCTVGNGTTLGGNAGAGANSAADSTLVGNNVSSGNRGNTIVGSGANADSNAATNLGQTGFNVVIGRTASVVSDQTNGHGESVAIGANVTLNGGNSVCVGFGINTTKVSAAGKGAILLGTYVTSSAGTNQIILDTRSDGTGPLADETRNNLIKIGDSTHSTVEIAGRNIAGIGGTMQSVADANKTLLATDAGAIYTSISAARVVTLPLANSVPIGKTLIVVDSSGSASGVNTITLTRAGADTINGGTTSAIITAFGDREVMSDGVSKWTVVRSF